MKSALKFSLTYSVISILLLILMQLFLGVLTMEVFSFVIWLYIFYLIAITVILTLFGFLADKLKLTTATRVICYAIFILLLINSIPFFDEGQVLSFELLKGLFAHSEQQVIAIIIHSIALLSFIITYLIYFRKSNHVQTTKAAQ